MAFVETRTELSEHLRVYGFITIDSSFLDIFWITIELYFELTK